MLESEAGKLLAVAAAYDNRKVTPEQIKAWHVAIGHLGFDECRNAIVAHAVESKEYLQVAHINDRVMANRRRFANLEGQERREFMDWCIARMINPTRIIEGDTEEIDAATDIVGGNPMTVFRQERQLPEGVRESKQRAAYGRAMARTVPKPDWFDQLVEQSAAEERRRRQ